MNHQSHISRTVSNQGIIDKLAKFGVNEENYQKASILMLPENLFSTDSLNELYETPDMILIKKLLIKNGVEVFSFDDIDIDLVAYDRRTANHWLGSMWIKDKHVIDLIIATLAGVIATGISDAIKSPPPAPRAPSGQISSIEKLPTQSEVHTNIYISNGDGSVTSINYKGDPKTLIDILKEIKHRDD